MQSTIFGENIFSKESKRLYLDTMAHIPERELIKSIDKHNHPTGFHVRGVAQFVAEFAISGIVQYTQLEKRELVRAAVLHDIGKNNVSRQILDKKSGLNKKEWQEIRHHPIEGYYQCAEYFSAAEMLPVLTHHNYQINDYPNRRAQEQVLSDYGLPSSELDLESTQINTLLIAVADHLEARYPLTDSQRLIKNIRGYNDRKYSVEELPLLVEASFIEAGKVKELKLDWLLRKLINYSKEIIL